MTEAIEAGNDGPVAVDENAPADVVIPENWKDALAEDLRDNATVQRFKTVEDAIRSTLSAQQMVGAETDVLAYDLPQGAPDQAPQHESCVSTRCRGLNVRGPKARR